MRIKGMVRRLLVAAALTATVAGGAVAATATPALAASTTCRTITVTGNWWEPAIYPHMIVPICYNGGSVWQSGPITPGVNAAVYSIGAIDWAGSYGGGTSFGVGENFAAVWPGVYTFYCTPRWAINVWGNVTSYSRNC